MNIVILGPQGSGKGTQAKLLAKRFDYHYASMGEILRETAQKDPKIDEIVNRKGELVPAETTFTILKKYLKERDTGKGIVLDGYPRMVEQYSLLQKWLTQKDKKVDMVIVLEISEKESIKRLSNRRMDPKTGKIYNLETSPKPGPEIDIKTLVQREDDKPEAIKTRLVEYRENTEPLFVVFEKEGILIRVDGERPIDVIQKDLISLVEERLGDK